MNKKLCVSVGLLSALAFFAGYYSWISCVILLAIVLICDTELTLKKNVIASTVLAAAISVIQVILNFVSSCYSDLLSTVNDLFDFWSEIYSVTDVLRKLDIADLISSILGIVYFVATIIFIIKSLKGNEVKVPFVSKLIDKHIVKEM